MPLPIQAFSHVTIRVADIDRSLAFYRDVFGFDTVFDVELDGEPLETLTGEPNARGRMVGGLIGGASVELFCVVSDAPAPTARSGPALGYTNLSFSVPSLDAAHAQAERDGHTPLPMVDIGGVRMFFLLDPDGTPVEVIEYPGDATTSAELWRGT
jgi:glyoxylase I family protein